MTRCRSRDFRGGRTGTRWLAGFLFICLSLGATSALRADREAFVSKADYSVQAGERFAEVTARLTVQTREGDGGHHVSLLPGDTPLRAAEVISGRAHFERLGRRYVLVAGGKGPCTVRLRYLSDILGGGSSYSTTLPLVSALASSIRFTFPTPGYVVDSDPHVPVEALASANATEARLYPGTARRITLRWAPEAPEAVPAPLFDVQERSMISLQPGLAARRTALHVRVKRGEVDRLTVLPPADIDILDLQVAQFATDGAPAAGKWEWAREEQGTAVVVRFEKAITDRVELRLLSEQVDPESMLFQTGGFRVRGAMHHTGALRVGAQGYYRTVDAGSEGVVRAEEPPEGDCWTMGGDAAKAALSFRYHSLPVTLKLRLRAVAPDVSVKAASHAYLQAGVVELETRMTCSVADAPLQALRIILPEGLIPLAVTGPRVQGWRVEGGDLRVRLTEPLLGELKLTVKAVQNLQRVDGVLIPQLNCADAAFGGGMVGISAGRNVSLVHHHATGFVQVDVQRLPLWMLERGPRLAYLQDRVDAVLAVSTQEMAPQVRAEGIGAVTVAEDAAREQYLFTCSVSARPVFGFRLHVPAGAAVQSVRGNLVGDWEYEPEQGAVNVTLAEPCAGRTQLRVALERQFDPEQPAVELGGVAIVGAERQKGRLGVRAKGNLELVPAHTVGMRPGAPEDFAAAAPPAWAEPDLAFHWTGPRWGLTCSIRRLSPRITADMQTTLRFGSGRAQVRSEITWHIANAAVDEFLIVPPEGAAGMRLERGGIAGRELVDGVWRVRLSGPVKGDYRMRVLYEISPDADRRVDYRPLSLPQARRWGGRVAAFAPDPRLEVAVEQYADVTPIQHQTGLLAGEGGALAAFSYSGGSPAIRFAVKTHQMADGVQVSVGDVRLATVVKERGDSVSYLSCRVSNQGAQHLSLELPQGGMLWGTYLDSEPVKPSRHKGGRILIPLVEVPSGKTSELGVIWSQGVRPMRLLSSHSLRSPQFDAPVTDIGWEVYLPVDREIVASGGNMTLQQQHPWYTKGLPGVFVEVWPTVRKVLTVAGAAILIVALVVGGILLFRRSRRALKVTVAVVVIVVVCAALFMPTLARARKEAATVSSLNNLRNVSAYLALYRNDHDGRFPPSLEALRPRYTESLDMFEMPLTGTRYEYNADVSGDEYLGRVPLLWEPYRPDAKSINVLFADGHAENIPVSEAEADPRLARVVVPDIGVAGRLAGLRRAKRAEAPPRLAVTGETVRGELAKEFGEALARERAEPELEERMRAGSVNVGVLASLGQTLDRYSVEGWEAQVSEDALDKTLLDLLKGDRSEARLKDGSVLRFKDGELVVGGPPERVDEVSRAVSRLQDRVLEVARETTRQQKEQQRELVARRREGIRRRLEAAAAASATGPGTISGSRAAGAMPLTISFPSTGTMAYPFRLDYAGVSRARISLTCIRAGAALVLQAVLLAVVFGIVAYVVMRRPGPGLALLVALIAVVGLCMPLAGAGAKPYVLSALAGVALAACVPLARAAAAGCKRLWSVARKA